MQRPHEQPTRKGQRVAIVGAGISGLTCARALRDRGLDVCVFEKSRGSGGRMATRRTDGGPQFDHGAQYFTVRDPNFARHVDTWLEEGVVAAWDGRIATLTNGQVEAKQSDTTRYVGVPGMTAIARHLARDLDIRFQCHVAAVDSADGSWRVRDRDGEDLGRFDFFLTSAPAPQSAHLLPAGSGIREAAEATPMSGCWAAMISFADLLDVPFDGAFVHDSPLSWIARNSSKPQRSSEQDAWVLHASPEWTTERIEAEPAEVLPQLLAAFWRAIGRDAVEPSYAVCHRWRFAIPPEPIEDRYLFDATLRAGACGDWCSGPRVEGAFLSGAALAQRVLTECGSIV